MNTNTHTGELALSTGSFGEGTTDENLLDVNCKARRSTTMILKMIRCKSPFECEWLGVCFEQCWQVADVEKQEIRETSEK